MQRERGFMKRLKEFDIYPKTLPEAQERSTSGAFVTIMSILFVVVLLFSEVYDFYGSSNKMNILTVHTNRGDKMQVTFKIIFPNLPCEVLNVDVTDKAGQDQVSIPSISKQPYAANFEDVRRKTFEGVGRRRFEEGVWNEMRRISKNFPGSKGGRCETCHLASHMSRCCNNCYELKIAYANAGLDFRLAENQPQCMKEKVEGPEGCLMSGNFDVAMAPGNFHIAVGGGHQEGENAPHHHHWPLRQRILGFNSTHFISFLAFGPIVPGVQNPLDGFSFVEPGIGQQNYFIQVVPTDDIAADGTVTKTNQYSFTSHHTKIDINDEHIDLPGVFFKYDISPIKIQLTDNRPPFSHFVTRLCAIIGGVWVVLGLLHSSMKTTVEWILKKLSK